MDVIEIETWAQPGTAVKLGRVGTIILGPVDSEGKIRVKLTLSRGLSKKRDRRSRGAVVDKMPESIQDSQDET